MACLCRVENPRSNLYKVIDVSRYNLDEVSKMVECYESAGFMVSIKVFDGKFVSSRFINPQPIVGTSDNRASA
jgi:hypothetical protein